jgi:antirestriction protein ArdC
MAKNVYQMVTNRVIEQMQQGIIPWHRPWTGAADGAMNYVTRRPYSLLNQLLLGRDGEWLTWKQIQDCGGKLKKGAKAGMVVYYGKFVAKKEKADGTVEEKEIPVLKYYNVFHLSDCTGIESKIENDVHTTTRPIDAAEDIINGYLTSGDAPRFHNDQPSNRAYYAPSTDTVVVPMLSQYKIAEEYYSTTFHELTHSTMKESRCNRRAENERAAFGSENYSREELVAELGAAMLCTVSGLDNDKAFKNSVAYLQGWLKALKNDNKMMVWAASRAEKAARYIMGENQK